MVGVFIISFLFVINFVSVYSYVPQRQPLTVGYIGFMQQMSDLQKRATTLVAQQTAYDPAAVIEREGFTCINGFGAFEQRVIQASQARPVLVFFYAQRDVASQELWTQLQPIVQLKKSEVDFVALDIYEQVSGAEEDDQNYRIAKQCFGTVGFKQFNIPAVVFFKEGLMCSSPEAIFSGSVPPTQVAAATNRLLVKTSKK